MYRARSTATVVAPAAKLIINNIVKRRYQELVCATLQLLACQHTVSQWCFFFSQLYLFLQPSRNVSTTPITAMGCRQCLPLSVVQLKGKHCQKKPHCRNGVVDTFGHCCCHHFLFCKIQTNAGKDAMR